MKQKKLSHVEINKNIVYNQKVYRYFDAKGKVVSESVPQSFENNRSFAGKLLKTADIGLLGKDRGMSGRDQGIQMSKLWTNSDESYYSASKYESSLGEKSGFSGSGGSLLSGSAGLVLSGGSLAIAEGILTTGFAIGNVVSSLDNMTIDGKNSTFAGRVFENQKYVDNIKFGLGVVSFGMDTKDLIKETTNEVVENKAVQDFSFKFINVLNDEVNAFLGT